MASKETMLMQKQRLKPSQLLDEGAAYNHITTVYIFILSIRLLASSFWMRMRSESATEVFMV